MFNPEVKSKYIAQAIAVCRSNDIKAYEKSMINWFNRVESYEEGFGKDLLDMTKEELRALLGEFLCGGKTSQLNNLSFLKTYYKWGANNRQTSIDKNWIDGIKLKDIQILHPYRNTMVSSEDDLVNVINCTFEDISENSLDNIIRCICLLLFAGIKYNDIWYLKMSDVDPKQKIIVCGNRTINMSDALYEIVKYNSNMKEMVVVGNGGTVKRAIDIVDEGYLISNTKKYNGDREKIKKTFNVPISNRLSASEKKDLTNTSIYDSGVFYRIYLNEKKTGDIDCIEYLLARRNQPATINYPERVKNKCRYEYEMWKKSLGIE